jgi:hypothetical protein
MLYFFSHVLFSLVSSLKGFLPNGWIPLRKAVREELNVSERVFVCHACGLVINRDLNASYHLADLA